MMVLQLQFPFVDPGEAPVPSRGLQAFMKRFVAKLRAWHHALPRGVHNPVTFELKQTLHLLQHLYVVFSGELDEASSSEDEGSDENDVEDGDDGSRQQPMASASDNGGAANDTLGQ